MSARRWSVAILTGVLVVACAGIAEAAFWARTSTTVHASAETLDPPTGLTASRGCPTLSQVVGTSTAGGRVTSLSISRPADVVAGDALVLTAIHHDRGQPPSAPSGWTVLARDNRSGEDGQVVLMAKIASAAEPATYSVGNLDASDATAAVLLVLRGADTSTATDRILTSNALSTTLTARSLTVDRGPALVLSFFLADDYLGSVTSGLTSVAHVEQSAPQPVSLDVRSQAVAAGTVPDRTATIAGSAKPVYAISVLVQPDVTSGTVTLGWTPTTDTYATGYQLFRSTGSTTSGVAGRTTASTTDASLAFASGATYTVRSVVGSSWTSASGPSVSVGAC